MKRKAKQVMKKNFNLKTKQRSNPLLRRSPEGQGDAAENEAEIDKKLGSITEQIQYNLGHLEKGSKRTAEVLTKEKTMKVVEKIAKRNDLSIPATLQALAMLFSLGGSNKRVPNTIKTTITSLTGQTVEINKAEVLNTLKAVTGDVNIKKLARALAPYILKLGWKLLQEKGIIIRGDLATTIEKRLRAAGQPSLTPSKTKGF